MLPKEVKHIGDGLIQGNPEFLNKILFEGTDIEQHYDIEQTPFAKWVPVSPASAPCVAN